MFSERRLRSVCLLVSVFLFCLLAWQLSPQDQIAAQDEARGRATRLMPLTVINKARQNAGLSPIDPVYPPPDVRVVDGGYVATSFEEPTPSYYDNFITADRSAHLRKDHGKIDIRRRPFAKTFCFHSSRDPAVAGIYRTSDGGRNWPH